MPLIRPSIRLPKLSIPTVFGRMSTVPVVGISMSDSAVTAALVDVHAGQYHLLDYAIAPCHDALMHGKIIDKSTLADAISTAVGQLLITPVSAITTVADDAIMRTRIELLGHLDDDEVEAAILVDAERYIGQPIDEVYVDFCIDDYVTHGSVERTQVWLTVAHRQAVDDCAEVLAMANLETQSVGVWSQSMAQAVRAFCTLDEPTVAVIDIQAHQTQLLVLDESEVTYRTTALFGTHTFTESQTASDQLTALQTVSHNPSDDVDSSSQGVSKSPSDDGLDFYQFLAQYQANNPSDHAQQVQSVMDLELSLESDAVDSLSSQQAEQPNTTQDEYQISFGDVSTDELRQVEKPAHLLTAIDSAQIDAMCDRLVTMLHNYQIHQAPLPSQLLLSGIDTAVWTGLDERLTEKLGIKAVYGVPDPQLYHADLGTDAPKLLTAMALSADIHGVNLLPWRDQKRLTDADNFKKKFITVLSIAAMILGVIYALMAYQAHKQAQVNAIITARIEENQTKINQIHAIEQKISDTRSKLAAIDLLDQDNQLLTTWQALPNLVPQGVYLDSIQESMDEVSITGMSTTSAQVSAFASSLELSEAYQEVLVTSLQDAKQAMRFSISAKKITPTNQTSIQDAQMIGKDN